MKTFTIYFLFFLVFIQTKIISSDIKITVKDLTNHKGFIHVALFDDASKFPKNNGKLLGLKKETQKAVREGIYIQDLQMGKYAIAIYHDENNNGRFDTFLGLPREKYGFSNDARVFLGPPKFSEASFDLSDNINLEMEIILR